MILAFSRRLRLDLAIAAALALQIHAIKAASDAIVVNGTSFALNGRGVSYRLHVDNETNDLVTDHFGAPVTEDGITAEIGPIQGWVNLIGRVRREFPDLGRGDFRTPAVEIKQAAGHTVSYFQYRSHDVVPGKPTLDGLPSLFGDEEDASTLIIHMYDNYSSVAADLSYSIFPNHDAIVRSVNITNRGNETLIIEKLASLSLDLPHWDLDMLELHGDWAREGIRVRRKVDYGSQGFGSTTGYSSHLHNPFLALVDRSTTEAHGEAFGFSLVYTGSFNVEVEKGSQGLTRAILGLHPSQFSWPLKPGESFTSPEAVAVYSEAGIGGMSRRLHRLYRDHLMRSKYATETRPILLNSWEGLYFAINETSVFNLAEQAADLGVSLFVLDDGWFANGEYARKNDSSGLGDWDVNVERFPDGLTPTVESITGLTASNSSAKLQFGLWFEPEMVNPKSKLYEEHPDWVIHAGDYPRTLTRNQLVLNVALPEVQEFIIESVSKYLRSAPITYVKWDNNRGIHETPDPNLSHRYMLGLYRVFQNLTTEFPDVLWNGCASGGGRFDPGMLQYFPQVWTSDNTDALDRLSIQFGTTLAYPPSSMGAHLSIVPNHYTGRVTPLHFRAHVSMMGGAWGLELNPADMEERDRRQIPELIKLAEKVNPVVIKGDLYRLSLPEESRYPAAMYISEDGNEAVLFAFQTRATVNNMWPIFKLQGLDKDARYRFNGTQVVSGATLMNIGVQLRFAGDLDSKVILLEKQ